MSRQAQRGWPMTRAPREANLAATPAAWTADAPPWLELERHRRRDEPRILGHQWLQPVADHEVPTANVNGHPLRHLHLKVQIPFPTGECCGCTSEDGTTEAIVMHPKYGRAAVHVVIYS